MNSVAALERGPAHAPGLTVMKIASGVDLIEIQRVGAAIERHGARLLERIYTPAELAEVGQNLPSLAARFAAKEAVSKALGTGMGKVSPKEIEVLRNAAGAPVLHLHGNALQMADLLGLQEWSLTLSHTASHAIAFVVALGH